MTRIVTKEISGFAAWPQELVYDAPQGTVIGFTMPYATGKPIHQLYGTKSRLSEFPKATWQFLAHTATNLARAFATLHAHGIVLGDVNFGNALVSDSGMVSLIDCDSFQIQASGHTYVCEVGVSEYTPPEIQSMSFRSVVRTPNHDAFGLAVLIFQLLFLGRHPFAGVYLGSGDMSLERAIQESRFAYGKNNQRHQYQPPPATLAFEDIPSRIQELFMLSFESSKRPQAKDWVTVLSSFCQQLQPCNLNQAHLFYNQSRHCPWCSIETNTSMRLFPFWLAQTASTSGFKIDEFWKQVLLKPPLFALQYRKYFPDIAPTAETINLGQYYRQGWRKVSTLLGLNQERNLKRGEVKVTITTLKSQLERIEQTDDGTAQEYVQKTVQSLEALKARYKSTITDRDQQLSKLFQNRERLQRAKYLDQFKISNATIHGIGASRKATLQSFGIETATDISRATIRRIYGFGDSLTASLLVWQQQVSKGFVFNPNLGVDPKEKMAIESLAKMQMGQTEQEIQQRYETLITFVTKTNITRSEQQSEIYRVLQNIAQ